MIYLILQDNKYQNNIDKTIHNFENNKFITIKIQTIFNNKIL